MAVQSRMARIHTHLPRLLLLGGGGVAGGEGVLHAPHTLTLPRRRGWYVAAFVSVHIPSRRHSVVSPLVWNRCSRAWCRFVETHFNSTSDFNSAASESFNQCSCWIATYMYCTCWVLHCACLRACVFGHVCACSEALMLSHIIDTGQATLFWKPTKSTHARTYAHAPYTRDTHIHTRTHARTYAHTPYTRVTHVRTYARTHAIAQVFEMQIYEWRSVCHVKDLLHVRPVRWAVAQIISTDFTALSACSCSCVFFFQSKQLNDDYSVPLPGKLSSSGV